MDLLDLNRARQRAKRDTRAYAPGKDTAGRADEQPPVLLPLGDLYGPTRRLAWRAPVPCRITSLALITDTAVDDADPGAWDFVWRREGTSLLSPWYRDLVMADTPLRYWRLADAAGATVADDEANNLDATYVGSPTLEVTGPPAGYKLAADFPGDGVSYVRSGPANLAWGNTLAMECWVRPDADITDDQVHIIGHATSGSQAVFGAAQPALVLLKSASGEPNGVRVYANGEWVAATKNWPKGWRTGGWNLITYSRTSASGGDTDDEIFVNGRKVQTVRVVQSYTDESVYRYLGVARGSGTKYALDGAMAEVALYDAPISLTGHRERYGVIGSHSTVSISDGGDGDILAGEPFRVWPSNLSDRHALLAAGDRVYLEVDQIRNPSTDPVLSPLADVCALIGWEAL